ncbi:MAG: ribonuclease HII [Chlamydiae bacterium]|nr:ribonuclease HII [Chlamydiota bacterium]MBI3266032.1 ribonuclease HII [Chlamydiota bacterium]
MVFVISSSTPSRDSFEKSLHRQGYRLIAGVDEAGRGPLAGPVVAAAVIFQNFNPFEGIRDSKKLSLSKREKLYHLLMEDPSILKGIALVDENTIDRINIREASFQAMKMALSQLTLEPDFVLVDGFNIPGLSLPQRGIPKGDDLSYSIGAASILAKVTRDHLMLEYEERYPGYGFKQHKGYGTQMHLERLKEKGPCLIHRKSFEPVRQLSIL